MSFLTCALRVLTSRHRLERQFGVEIVQLVVVGVPRGRVGKILSTINIYNFFLIFFFQFSIKLQMCSGAHRSTHSNCPNGGSDLFSPSLTSFINKKIKVGLKKSSQMCPIQFTELFWLLVVSLGLVDERWCLSALCCWFKFVAVAFEWWCWWLVAVFEELPRPPCDATPVELDADWNVFSWKLAAPVFLIYFCLSNKLK